MICLHLAVVAFFTTQVLANESGKGNMIRSKAHAVQHTLVSVDASGLPEPVNNRDSIQSSREAISHENMIAADFSESSRLPDTGSLIRSTKNARQQKIATVVDAAGSTKPMNSLADLNLEDSFTHVATKRSESAEKSSSLNEFRADSFEQTLNQRLKHGSSVLARVHVSVTKTNHEAAVKFAHKGHLHQYRLTPYSVFSEDAVAIEISDLGEVPLSGTRRKTFRSTVFGNVAAAMLLDDGTISGIFETRAGAMVELRPQIKSNITGPILMEAAQALHHISPISPASFLFGGEDPIVESDGDEIEKHDAQTEHVQGIRKWFPGCYTGDDVMHELTIGVVIDKYLYDRPGYGPEAKNHVEGAISETSLIFEHQLHIRLKVNLMKVYSTIDGNTPLYAKESPGSTSLLSRLHRLQEAIRDRKIKRSAITHLFSVKGEVQGYGILRGVCKVGDNVGADLFWDTNGGFSVFRHEVGHNLGGDHCPPDKAKGGIMCGNGQIHGATQFQKYNEKEICKTLDAVVNKCDGNFKPEPTTWGGCFPGDSKVTLPSGDQIFLRDLARGQLISTADTRTGRIVFERFLGDLHTDAEHSQAFEFINLIHEHGALRVSASHLVKTLEHGFVPADQVELGDHLFVRIEGLSDMLSAKVLSVKTSVDVGLFAPLTFSGTIIVDGVLASTYTIDELRRYVRPNVQQRIIASVGYDGVNSIMHLLAFPLRVSFRIGLLDFVERAMSLNLPGSSFIRQFFLPYDANAQLGDMHDGDGLPGYVDFVGRTVGFAFNAAFSW